MRRIIVPCSLRANSQLNSAVRAPPTCKYPVGEGANRTRTLPVLCSARFCHGRLLLALFSENFSLAEPPGGRPTTSRASGLNISQFAIRQKPGLPSLPSVPHPLLPLSQPVPPYPPCSFSLCLIIASDSFCVWLGSSVTASRVFSRDSVRSWCLPAHTVDALLIPFAFAALAQQVAPLGSSMVQSIIALGFLFGHSPGRSVFCLHLLPQAPAVSSLSGLPPGSSTACTIFARVFLPGSANIRSRSR